MLGIARVAKAFTHPHSHPSSAAMGQSSPAGHAPRPSAWGALGRIFWGQVAALPTAALGLPDLLRAFAERAHAIPVERRRAPPPTLVLKVLPKLARAEGDLREAYLSMLTAAADSVFADVVHPAFADVLNQLHGDELSILRTLDHDGPFPVISVSSRLQHGGGSRVELRHFSLLGEQAGCRFPERTAAYLDNLARLGLIEIRPTRVTDDVRMFQELELHPTVVTTRTAIERQPPVRVGPLSEPIVADVNYKSLLVTSFGRQFRDVCFFRPERPPHPPSLLGARKDASLAPWASQPVES